MARLIRKPGNLWVTMLTSNAPLTLAKAFVAASIVQRVYRSVAQ